MFIMIPMLGLFIVVTLAKVKQRLLPNTAGKRSYTASILVNIILAMPETPVKAKYIA